MKVVPVGGQSQSAAQTQNMPQDIRQKAIEAFMKPQGQSQQVAAQTEQPMVKDANNVSPEELSAISKSTDSKTPDEGAPMPSEPAAAVEDTSQQAPAKEPDPAVSRQFAQLARQEKALRAKAQAQEQALKAREAALAAKEAELAAKQPDLSKFVPKDRLVNDALTVLAEAGISYDSLTQQLIDQQQYRVDPRVQAHIQKLESQLQKLEQAAEEGRKSQAQAQQDAYNSAVKQLKIDAKRMVDSDPSFETIKVTNSVQDVVDLITETYKKDGVLMTVEEAAKEVEDYLVEEASKLARIKKIQQRLQAQSTEKQTATAQKPVEQTGTKQPQMKTLTNTVGSQRQLSARERAVMALNGNKS